MDFRFVWTMVYRFWADLIFVPKLDRKENFVKISRYSVLIVFLFSIPKKCTGVM